MCGKYHATDKQQEGAVLIFTVLLLTFMSLIGFALASLSLREVRLARTFDDSLQSYYAAESGIERSLDVIEEYRAHTESQGCPAGEEGAATLGCVLEDIESFATPASPVSLTESVATYAIDADATISTVDVVHVPILQHSSTQLELYDPDNPLTPLGVDSLLLLWNPTCTEQHGLEITFSEFDSTTTFFPYEDVTLSGGAPVISKQIWQCISTVGTPYEDMSTCFAISNLPSVSKSYTVRLKSLDCVIPDVMVSTFSEPDAEGTSVPIPSRIEIAVLGSGQQSQRRMTAKTKWLPSASGLVDFVLFSEEEIVK